MKKRPKLRGPLVLLSTDVHAMVKKINQHNAIYLDQIYITGLAKYNYYFDFVPNVVNSL